MASLDENTGMDQYRVRTWPTWHRHITLSLMAHAWLVSVRQRSLKKPGPELAELSVSEVRRLLEWTLPLPPRSALVLLAWFRWHRTRVPKLLTAICAAGSALHGGWRFRRAFHRK